MARVLSTTKLRIIAHTHRLLQHRAPRPTGSSCCCCCCGAGAVVYPVVSSTPSWPGRTRHHSLHLVGGAQVRAGRRLGPRPPPPRPPPSPAASTALVRSLSGEHASATPRQPGIHPTSAACLPAPRAYPQRRVGQHVQHRRRASERASGVLTMPCIEHMRLVRPRYEKMASHTYAQPFLCSATERV